MVLFRRTHLRDYHEAIRASADAPNAFEAIFDRHYDAVHRYAQRRRPARADEIASETFLVAFRNRARWIDRQHGARPWLLGIATNLIRESGRNDQRWLRAAAATPPETGSSGWEDEIADRLEAGSQSRAVAEALSTLSEGDRDAFLLYVLADLTYEEVANALDIPLGTVASRISRARRRLAVEVAHTRKQPHSPEVSPHG